VKKPKKRTWPKKYTITFAAEGAGNRLEIAGSPKQHFTKVQGDALEYGFYSMLYSFGLVKHPPNDELLEAYIKTLRRACDLP
jgi:hypothetical protein